MSDEAAQKYKQCCSAGKYARRLAVSVMALLFSWMLTMTALPQETAPDRALDLGSLIQSILEETQGSSGSTSQSSDSPEQILELILGSLLGEETVSISKATVSAIPDQIYTGKAIRPVPKVTYQGKTLKRGTDYTLTYSDNTKIGTGKCVLKGKGNFTGQKTVSFQIVSKSGRKKTDSSSGKKETEKKTGSSSGKKETEKKTGSSSGNKDTEKKTSGKGSFVFTVSCQAAEQVYNGNVHKPAVSVLVKGKKISSTDYSVSYKDNRYVGTATVTVTGKGDYKGYSGTASFKILPPKVSLTSVTAGPGSLVVKWKKTAQTEGYQIEYCTRKGFDQNVKRRQVKTPDTQTFTLDKLDSGKNYYVRIRSYKKVGSRNWYGQWSVVKNMKTE